MRVAIIFFFIISGMVQATGAPSENRNNEEFDATEMIMHHIADSHEWHIISFNTTAGNEFRLTLPLPIIIWHNGGFHSFLSNKFNGGKSAVSVGYDYVALYHGHIYLTDSAGTILKDQKGEVINSRVLDFSITRNVASMFLGVFLILIIFGFAARGYSKRGGLGVPKGIQLIVEPVILYVRDDIIRAQIHGKKADLFTPYLLTLFFFIWVNNLIGLVPFFPGGSNLSGNIAFTLTLAIISFLATNLFASGHYWKEILIAPGTPFFVKIFLVPVEIIGLFTKPFALMLRLFANITAGHIIILSLATIIFVLKSIYVAPLTILLSLVMFSLEFLVALLQAYIFTLLTSLFIGMAVNDTNH